MSLNVYLEEMRLSVVYEKNITHNLNEMAEAAGIYTHLWRPEDIGINAAGQLIAPLTLGLDLLLSDSEKFKKLNPENGWGDYDGLVDFVRDYLKACKKNPHSKITVSR